MALTLDVAQVGAYVEIDEEQVLVAQVGAYVEVDEEDEEDAYGPKLQVI